MVASPTSVGSGTLVTSASEQTVLDIASAGNYLITVDTSALADGEVLTVRAKRRVLITGTIRNMFQEHVQIRNPLGRPVYIYQSVALPGPFGMQFSIQQTVGSARSVPWNVERIGSPAVAFSGTLAGNAGAEAALATVVFASLGGHYALVADLSTFGDDDSIRLLLSREVIFSGTRRVDYEEVFSGAQAVPIALSAPLTTTQGLEARQQILGGSVIMDWSLERL